MADRKIPRIEGRRAGRDRARDQHHLGYIETHYARGKSLVPADPERARDSRLRERFFDLYVNVPLGKIVTDKLRPDGQHDPLGVQQARLQLETAYAVADDWLSAGPWQRRDIQRR